MIYLDYPIEAAWLGSAFSAPESVGRGVATFAGGLQPESAYMPMGSNPWTTGSVRTAHPAPPRIFNPSFGRGDQAGYGGALQSMATTTQGWMDQ